MKIKNKFIMVALVWICQTSLASDEVVFQPVDALFLAMSNVDHAKMKAAVTKDFILLEHGEVWTIEDLMAAVKPSEYKRTNYFSVIGVHSQADMAWINYWNKANFDNNEVSQDVVWLESVVVVQDQGVWKLAQMHSTRLDPNKVPADIAFIKQQVE